MSGGFGPKVHQCEKCSTKLDEKEFKAKASPTTDHQLLARKLTLEEEVFDNDMIVLANISEAIKRKTARELKNYLTPFMKDPSSLYHALCKQCLDLMLNDFIADSNKLKEKRQAVEDLIPKFRSEISSLQSRASQIHERYKQALLERERLEQELKVATESFDKEKNILLRVRKDAKLFCRKEEEFAEEAMKWRGDKHRKHENWDSFLMKINSAKAELELRATILDDAFRVDEARPPYFSINSLRMGRKPSGNESDADWNVVEGATAMPASEYEHVEWKEINAAWGEACLLLCILANKAQLHFKEYNLIPRGNRSLVQEKKRPEVVHRLYFEDTPRSNKAHSGATASEALEWGLSLIGLKSQNQDIESFNQAMVGFLICLKELAEFARDSPKGTQLNLRTRLYPIKSESFIRPNASSTSGQPTAMDVDATVKGLSIRTTTLPSDAKRWTDACKFTLANMKWLIVWAIKS